MLRSVDYFLLVLSLQLDSQLIGVSELTLRLLRFLFLSVK